MMRYKDIAPKFTYVIGLALNILILMFLTFVNTKAIESGEIVAIVLVGVITTFSLLYTILYVNKCIHLKIDVEANKIIYGNIWFTQEVEFFNLKEIRKISLFRNLYKIKLADKKFYFVGDQSQRGYIQTLIKSTPLVDLR